jgi:O-antigen ligase
VTFPTLMPPVLSTVDGRRSSRKKLDAVLLYGVFGLVLLGPLLFGALEYWARFTLEIGSTALFMVWVGRQIGVGSGRITPNPLFSPMLFFAGLIVLQLALGASAYRNATVSRALLYCAYGMICFLAAQTLRHASQAKSLATVVTIYGSAVAFFALVQGVASNGKIYWMREAELGGWIYGPYINHNHYAGLMEMLVPVPLVFCLTRYAYGTRKILAALAAALMASTVFLSGSRGGMLALMMELMVLFTLIRAQQRKLKVALSVGVFLVLVFGLLAWIGGGELANRLASVHTEARAELSGGTRLTIARDGLGMFLQKPIVGWGLGTFPVIYPHFRSFYTNFFVNEAHDDYIQLLAEMGALGLGAMVWFVVVLYRHSWKKLGDWNANMNGAASLAALIGCTGILVHSFLDFNLQVPANAVLFYTLATIAVSCPFEAHSHRRRRSSHVTEIEENAQPVEPA